MLQIAILIMGGIVLFQGIRAIAGKEKGNQKTSTGVAIASIVVGVGLLIFALLMPTLLQMYLGP
jgi:hypothetical protein